MIRNDNYEGLTENQIALQQELELEKLQSYDITKVSWGVYNIHQNGAYINTVKSVEEAERYILSL